LNILDVWFDLSYGGLTVSIDDVLNWDYPTIYYFIKRMEVQKNFENKQAAQIKATAKKS